MNKMKQASVFLMIFFIASIVGCAKTDVSGKYNGKLSVAGAERQLDDIDFMLVQKGNALTGNMTIKQFSGDGQLKLNGTVENQKVVFNTESQNGLYISFVGKCEGKTIKGDAELTMSSPRIGVQHDKAVLEMVKQ